MEGRDMIGRAITGSGKTLAFGIPILNNIIQNKNQNRFVALSIYLFLLPKFFRFIVFRNIQISHVS